jgi:hypothetical protein
MLRNINTGMLCTFVNRVMFKRNRQELNRHVKDGMLSALTSLQVTTSRHGKRCRALHLTVNEFHTITWDVVHILKGQFHEIWGFFNRYT